MGVIDPILDRKGWLESRRQGIGGSDVAALFDVHPWMSKYTLYMDKMGLLPEKDSTAAMLVGHELEPLTRRLYQEDTDRQVHNAQERFKHHEHSFMLATTDGTVIRPDRQDEGVFEGKTTNPFSAKDWAEGPPLHYVLQCHHYMVTSGRKWASVAVLVLGEKDPLRWCDIELDQEFAEMMIDAEQKFWNGHILAQRPPPVDSHPKTTEFFKKHHIDDTLSILDMDDSDLSVKGELDGIKAQIKELMAQKDLLENRLKAKMVDSNSTYAVFPDGSGFTYKTVEVKEHLRKASKSKRMVFCSAKRMGEHKKYVERKLLELA